MEEEPIDVNPERDSGVGDNNVCVDGQIKSKRSQQGLPNAPPVDSEVYGRFSKRGAAIILNHKHFDMKGCSTRQGTDKDRDDMAKLLKELRFNVTMYNDLTFREIITVLDVVSKMDHSQSECLLIAVMSHGEDGILYAKDCHYPTRKLWTFFTPLHCPTLAGKPKLFFIQACRGDKTDPGVEVCTDSNNSNKIYSIPVMADILVMYATVEGYYAWRHPTDGSYFIQSLIRQLRKYHNTKDLLSILTCVNREVAVTFRSSGTGYRDMDQKKEMCSIVSMLTRDFYLN